MLVRTYHTMYCLYGIWTNYYRIVYAAFWTRLTHPQPFLLLFTSANNSTMTMVYFWIIIFALFVENRKLLPPRRVASLNPAKAKRPEDFRFGDSAASTARRFPRGSSTSLNVVHWATFSGESLLFLIVIFGHGKQGRYKNIKYVTTRVRITSS